MMGDSTTGNVIQVSTIALLAATDYIELYAFLINSKTTVGGGMTYLSAVMLGATS